MDKKLLNKAQEMGYDYIEHFITLDNIPIYWCRHNNQHKGKRGLPVLLCVVDEHAYILNSREVVNVMLLKKRHDRAQ